jgi:hypothetical protein
MQPLPGKPRSPKRSQNRPGDSWLSPTGSSVGAVQQPGYCCLVAQSASAVHHPCFRPLPAVPAVRIPGSAAAAASSPSLPLADLSLSSCLEVETVCAPRCPGECPWSCRPHLCCGTRCCWGRQRRVLSGAPAGPQAWRERPQGCAWASSHAPPADGPLLWSCLAAFGC